MPKNFFKSSCIHTGVLFCILINAAQRAVDAEQHDDKLAPEPPENISENNKQQAAKKSARHHAAVAIAVAAKHHSQTGERDKRGYNDIQDLDDLQGDHFAEG